MHSPKKLSSVWSIRCSPILAMIALTVVLFFIGGIFVGSRFASGANPSDIQQSALPGTRNIFSRWHLSSSSSSSTNPVHAALRGYAVANRNQVMKDLILETETKQAEPSQASSFTSTSSRTEKESNINLSTVDRSASLYATRTSFMSGPSDLDADRVVAGVWVYLDDSGSADKDMRTIFSNKMAGCENKPTQHGFALYVNSWGQSDHKLHVEYGGGHTGCNKVDSGSDTLVSKRWYHVAVALIDSSVHLFIDGKVVQSSLGAQKHYVQRKQPLTVGQYAGGEYSLAGNLSSLAIAHFHGAADHSGVGAIVNDMMKLSVFVSGAHMPQLKAFFPLTDAVLEIASSRASEYVAGNHGTYHFPLVKGVRVGGIQIPLQDGVNGRPVTSAMKAESQALGKTRRETIKGAMKFVWGSYKKYAWGRDELKPLSRTGQDNWGGMGVTLVDSLDTLWILGMTSEFSEAKEWVVKHLTFKNAGSVSVFETTIRELGGLLSAYDLSGDAVFRDKAIELGRLLSPAFDSRTGIAHGMVNLRTGSPVQGWAGTAAILSELGSLQLEFRNLAKISGDSSLETKAMKAIQLLSKKKPDYGLFPIKVDIENGAWADSHVTFGALGDSFYEYLLKVWLQGGKKETWLRVMYDQAMDGVMTLLLKASDSTGLAFLSDWTGRNNLRKMDHLVCFMPGTLALGAYNDPLGLDSPRAQRDLAVAKALMYTCREMYHRTTSGIAPEYVDFPPGGDMAVGSTAPFYILRPETAESLFVLGQLTGDPIYRDWAWEIFSAIEKHCRTAEGYGALRNVNNPADGIDDRMESFFLAETIKYLYLAQDPDVPIDLTTYVFNTEAHPTRIFDDSHVPITSG